MTHPLFSTLSIAYICAIFLLPFLLPEGAISRVWNPYSLLHLPLYGVLMLLLTLALVPGTPGTRPLSLLLPGAIASGVGGLDEAIQTRIPFRDGSICDLLLDLTGILLTALLIILWQKKKKSGGR